MTNSSNDKWSTRFYPGFTPVTREAYEDGVLDKWRDSARATEAATGREVDYIDTPIKIERISRPAHAMPGERSILNWACEGTLRKHGGGK